MLHGSVSLNYSYRLYLCVFLHFYVSTVQHILTCCIILNPTMYNCLEGGETMNKGNNSIDLFKHHSTDDVAYDLALIYCKEHINEYESNKDLVDSFIDKYSKLYDAINKGSYERCD